MGQIMLNLKAKITGIKYKPSLCKQLNEIDYSDLDNNLQKYSSYLCKFNDLNKIAISWWVSAKRTRTYPLARVYDTLSFGGKKVTIIPVFKDEGIGGDRDYIQWDTISLMSLLGIYLIISFYDYAHPSKRDSQKITHQRFNTAHTKNQLEDLIIYKSDALHWNLNQAKTISDVGEKALLAYHEISQKTGIPMHSNQSVNQWLQNVKDSMSNFITNSRNRASIAQNSESMTEQPKEKTEGEKAKITITNYLGGEYFLTVDEAIIKEEKLLLVEAKHTKRSVFPALSDIKEGLVKMSLFSNISELTLNDNNYEPVPVLKLSSEYKILGKKFTQKHEHLLTQLYQEGKQNGFEVRYLS